MMLGLILLAEIVWIELMRIGIVLGIHVKCHDVDPDSKVRINL